MQATLSVIKFNVKSLVDRLGGAVVIVVGIAVVSAVLAGALAIAAGYHRAFASVGQPDVVMVVSPKAKSEVVSRLSKEEVTAVKQAPGVARTASGPLVAPDYLDALKVHYRESGLTAQIALRGITTNFKILHPKVTLLAGRWFKPGTAEIDVGQGAASRFDHLQIGDKITSNGKTWTVVGILDGAGTAFGSEAWTGLGDVQDANQNSNSDTAAYVKLTSPAAFKAFSQALADNPQVVVKAVRERKFYAAQSSRLTGMISKIGGVAALLMGIAAMFGAMSTLYTAIANRAREIATMRAIGFRRGAVLTGVIAESLFLALLGGIVGTVIAYAALNGFHASTIAASGQMISNKTPQVGFTFAVTPVVMAIAVGWALIVGLIGGLFPAIRAARLPVATALRQA